MHNTLKEEDQTIIVVLQELTMQPSCKWKCRMQTQSVRTSTPARCWLLLSIHDNLEMKNENDRG